MNGPASLAYPGSRSLAAWWGQLTAFQPTSWWVGHLLLHRIDALAGQTRPCPLEPLDRALLAALASWPNSTVAQLDDRLRVGPSLLRQAFRCLADAHLAAVDVQGCWQLTDRGKYAREHGECPSVVFERRPFFFTEGGHFLALPPTIAVPHPAPADWSFDAGALRNCVGQSDDWKERHGFPREVESMAIGPGEPGNGLPAWRRVALDRAVRLPVAVVRCADEKLFGFPMQTEKWALQTDPPAFTLSDDWRTIFPELAAAPTATELLQAWQGWCQPRGVVNVEAERIAVDGHRLRVEASAKVLDRLRGARSDIAKGDGWVLVGTGKLRAALLLEIVEASVQADVTVG
jgi:hypothetical protein